MSDNVDDLIEDEDFIPSDEDLQSISELANTQLKLETTIDQLEAALKSKKVELRKIQENLLPEAMENAGTNLFGMTNGGSIKLKSDMSLSVPKKHLPEIVEWLRENGHGGMIKNTLTIPFAKEQDNMVAEIIAQAEKVGLDVKRDVTVHSTSLKSLIKGETEQGTLDKELSFFGAYAWKKAIIEQ